MNRFVAKTSMTNYVSRLTRPSHSTQESPPPLRHRQALVVGGTKGIGSGVAGALVRSGCCARVDVVGRDEQAGEAMVRKMGGSSDECAHRFWRADLSTLAGCDELLGQLKGESPYDLLVFTVGVWPDRQSPFTSEGFHKVGFLDVICRFRILTKMLEAGLLQRSQGDCGPVLVMSVLACGQAHTIGTGSAEERKDILREKVLKRYLGKEAEDYREPRNVRVPLMTAGFAHDTMLATAAKKFGGPEGPVRFVGTFPGLVATDVMASTVGSRIPGVLNFLASWVPGGMVSTDTAGDQHVEVLREAFWRCLRPLPPELQELQACTPPGGKALAFWNAAMGWEHELPECMVDEVGEWLWGELERL